MNWKARLLQVCCLTAMALAPFKAGHSQDAAKKGKAEWTFLLYLAADNDLESFSISNIEELAEIGSTADVHFIVLADRSPKGSAARNPAASDDDNQEAEVDAIGYTNRDLLNLADWAGTKLLRVEKDHLHEIEDWDDANMGDPATLRKFVRQAAKLYPAKRYGLILSDHGGGWAGICVDETAKDALSTPELRDALKQATGEIGPLEFLGFDACLMANLEVFHEVAPFARVLVGSEELVPGTGWNYVPVARTLTKKPNQPGLDVAEVVADSFRDFFSKANRKAGHGVTLSVVKSEQLAAVTESIQTFSDRLVAHFGEETGAWLQMARTRARSLEFGRNDATGKGSALFDLVHIAELLRDETKSKSPEVSRAAEKLIKSVGAAVVHNVCGKERRNSHGLTIYFPPTAEIYKGNVEAYARLGFTTKSHWGAFLARYVEQAGRHEHQPLLGEIRISGKLVDAERSVTVSSHAKPDALADADFLVIPAASKEREAIAVMTTAPGDAGLLSEEWDGGWYTLRCGKQTIPCPVLIRYPDEDDDEEADAEQPASGKCRQKEEDAAADDESDDGEYVDIPVQLRHQGKQAWIKVTLTFLADFSETKDVGEFVEATREGDYGVREVELQEGDEIRPMRSVLRSDGTRRIVPAPGVKPLTIDDPEKLTLGYRRLPAGKYLVGFAAADVAGVTEEQFVEIEVKK